MSYSIQHQPEDNLIWVNIEGETNISELRNAAAEIARTARQAYCFRILTDLRQATLNVSTMDMHSLPGKVEESIAAQGFNLYSFKRAFVVAQDQKILEFYETVSSNQGHNAVMFRDVERARNWLKGK